MSFYQYEPPVAMFSMAEVDKVNRYEGTGMALFARGEDRATRIARANTRRMGQGKSVIGSSAYAFEKGRRLGGRVADAVSGPAKGAMKLGKGAYGMAHGGASFLGKGASMALGGVGNTALAGGSLVGGLAKMAGGNLASRPGRAGAILGGLAAAGAGGAYFLRRRRSKRGKMIVEQVRR
jgi:hypothetical protein